MQVCPRYHVAQTREFGENPYSHLPTGAGGMTYGWLIALIFIQCVAMSMAELCSSMPTR